MNEHKLDDLIIGEPTPINNKSKSLLAIIALIIIILLVGILLAKMIFGSPEDDVLISDNNKTEFVAPKIIFADNTDDKDSIDELTPITKEKLPEPEPEPEPEPKPKPKEKPKKKVQKPKPQPTPKQEIIKKKVEPKKAEPKPATKKPTKQETSDKASKPSELFSKSESIYYIQVGAFNRDPNPKYLTKIKSAGFNYIINKNEKTQRVRVGPYGSYSEAKDAVADISSSIGIVGFVIKSVK